MSADNGCDDEKRKIVFFKSDTFFFLPLLQPTVFRKLDLPPSSYSLEKVFLVLRRTEAINLLGKKSKVHFCTGTEALYRPYGP